MKTNFETRTYVTSDPPTVCHACKDIIWLKIKSRLKGVCRIQSIAACGMHETFNRIKMMKIRHLKHVNMRKNQPDRDLPFGWPVLPDVYKMNEGSSASIDSGGQ